MTSFTKRKTVIKGKQGRGLIRVCGSCKAKLLTYNSAHRSNKNSKINDDNPETVEILQNPITKYDAHKAEGNM